MKGQADLSTYIQASCIQVTIFFSLSFHAPGVQLCAGQNGWPPTSDTWHLGCSYTCTPVTVFFPPGVQLGYSKWECQPIT